MKWAYKDISLPFFQDTEVELHIKPGLMFNPFHNRTWQDWYKSNKGIVFLPTTGNGFSTPSVEFNLIYILHHCYMHLFESGVGLRQLMDYYFVLKELDKKACGEKAVLTKTEKTAGSVSSGSVNLGNADSSSEIVSKLPSSAAKSSLDADSIEETASVKNTKNIVVLFEHFGMKRFATGIMWIMQHVFGLEDECLLCEADEREGKFLLNEIMQSGNFGKQDDRFEHNINNRIEKLKYFFKRSMMLVRHYPQEALWMPWYFVWHYIMKLIKR